MDYILKNIDKFRNKNNLASLNEMNEFNAECEKILDSKFSEVTQNEKNQYIIKSLKVSLYEKGGVIVEPIEFNINNGSEDRDQKAMGLSPDQFTEYIMENYVRKKFQKLQTMAYLFNDGKDIHEYIFSTQEISNNKNEADFCREIKNIMVISKFKEQLETGLEDKSTKSQKKKI